VGECKPRVPVLNTPPARSAGHVVVVHLELLRVLGDNLLGDDPHHALSDPVAGTHVETESNV